MTSAIVTAANEVRKHYITQHLPICLCIGCRTSNNQLDFGTDLVIWIQDLIFFQFFNIARWVYSVGGGLNYMSAF